MIQKLIINKVLEIATKKITKKFKLGKVLDYVEQPNDADERIDKLEISVFNLRNRIEKLEENG